MSNDDFIYHSVEVHDNVSESSSAMTEFFEVVQYFSKVSVHAGRDGLIRSVRVKTASEEFVRPVEKLCFLEGKDI